MFNKKLMQLAVAVIVDRTTDDVRCNYTPLSGLAFVSIWVYIGYLGLLIYSLKPKSAFGDGSLLLMPAVFLKLLSVFSG